MRLRNLAHKRSGVGGLHWNGFGLSSKMGRGIIRRGKGQLEVGAFTGIKGGLPAAMQEQQRQL